MPSTRSSRLVVTTLFACLASGQAWATSPGRTTVIDRPSGLGAPTVGAGNSASLGRSVAGAAGTVSGDATGRWVVFTSRADSLLTTTQDDAGDDHVYELDRQTGIVLPVSIDTAGLVVDGGAPSVSADGTKVAFITDAPIDATYDQNNGLDVYVRYLATGQTVLASRAAGQGGAIGSVGTPRINAVGDRVAFSTSNAADIGDTNGKVDVYVRDLGPATTRLISRATGAAGAVGNGASKEPAINADGTAVSFTSTATNLDAADDANGSQSDIFLRTTSQITNLVSMRTGIATGGDGPSDASDLSPDGATVVFASRAADLVAAPINGRREVFRRQVNVPGMPTTLVSKAPGGAAADDDTSGATISVVGASGWVAFSSAATNLVPGQTDGSNALYVADGTGVVRLASRAPGANGAPLPGGAGIGGLGAASRVLAYDASSDVLVRDVGDPAEPQRVADHAPGSLAALPQDVYDADVGDSRRIMSDDGRYVVFESAAPALPGSGDGTTHVFRRDGRTGETIVLDRASGPSGALGDDDASSPVISADGDTVAFISGATLDPAGDSSSSQVWVRRISAQTTTLASRADGAGGQAQTYGAQEPALSGDGTRVAWTTRADTLGDGDTNSGDDVHLRDLQTNRTILVSRPDGAATASGAGGGQASLDYEGDRVAFSSNGTLGDGAPAVTSSVHVRDLGAGTTRLVSRADGSGGAPGANASSAPSISADGQRVAFESLAANLVPGDAGPTRDVFVRDLSTGRTVLASRADGAAGPRGSAASRAPALSADGSTVAFESFATNLTALAMPGTAAPVTNVFVRALARDSTLLVSRADGPGGAPADDAYVTAPQISGDGGCVAFVTRARSIALGSGVSSDWRRIYQRTVNGSCPPAVAAPTPPGAAPGPGVATPPRVLAQGKPVLSSVRLLARRFRVGSARTATAARVAKRTPTGTRVDFRLSNAATVTFTFARELRGRRVGRSCKPATGKLRGRPACTRAPAAGTLRRTSKAGVNRVAFSGRIGRRALRPGRYRVTVRAANAAGRSAAVVLRFVVVRR